MAHSDKYQDVLIKPGMAENIDSRMLPLGTPRLIQNMRTRQAGRFEKRPGTEAKATSGLPTAGKACWVGDWNGQPVTGILDTEATGQEDTNIRVFNGTHWGYTGRHGACVPHRRFGIAGRERGIMYNFESAVAVNGLLYVVYHDVAADSSDIIYLQERTPEGTPSRSLRVLAEDSPQIVWTGSAFYLVTNASGTVKVRQLNMAAFTLGTAVSLPTAAASSETAIDVAPLEGSTDWLICYAASATELAVRRMAGTTASASATVTTTAAPARYAIAGHVTHGILVTYRDGDDAQATILTASLGSPAEVTLQAGTAATWFVQFVMVRVDTDKFVVLLGRTTTSGNISTAQTLVKVVNTGGAGSVSSITTFSHFVPACKPMRVGADGDAAVYCWFHNGIGDWETTFRARHILVDVEHLSTGFGAQLAGIAYEHQPQTEDGAGPLGAVADLGDGRFAACLNWADPGEAGLDCAVFSLAGPATSVAQAHRFTSTSGGALYVSGACLYDIGDPVIVQPTSLDAACLVTENGFAHAPLISATGATGGAFTAGQAYSWKALYRHIDAMGRIHRSSAATVATGIVATGTYLKANVAVAAIGVSNRFRAPGESVAIEAYRSWNGGPYYFVGDTESTFGAVAVTISDTASDASLEDNPVIYTDLGILPTEPPSGAALMCQGGQRLAVRTWRANVGQYSKLYVAGAPWEFCDHDTFRSFFPEDITAVGYMDGAWVWFSANKIFLVTGDGPNDQGSGLFSEPRELPAACGADSPHVVEVQAGLMFKGGGTIWLLPRGFGPPEPVGDAIQETLGRFPHLRAAFRAVNANDDCTHFTLASADLPGASTYVAVLDNRFQSWSLDKVGGDVGAAAAVGGKFTWLTPSWSATTHVPARQYGVSQFQDYSAAGASLWIEQRIEFGDWRPFGVLGQGRLGRVGVLGEYGGTGLGPAPPLNAAWTIDEAVQVVQQISVGGAAGGGFFREIVPAKQAGTAFQLSIYDSRPSTFVPSHVINALGIEVETEPGLRRPNDGERV